MRGTASQRIIVRSAIFLYVGIFLAVCCQFTASYAQENERIPKWSVVHAGTLLADADKAPMRNQSIIIRDGFVVEIRNGFVDPSSVKDIPNNAEIIDLSQKFVLPGLIDAHTHIAAPAQAQSLQGRLIWRDSRWALWAIEDVKKTLHSGFTTVRDTGGFTSVIYDIRDAIAAGLIDGPRILAVPYMLTPHGGHGDRLRLRAEISEPELLSVCDGPMDCREKIRIISSEGADFIKIKVTAGILSGTPWGQDYLFYDDELNEIVRTAHDLNLKVAAHALTVESTNMALRAGVDSIEHGVLDSESIRLFKQTGAYLVPTVYASELLATRSGDPSGDEVAQFIAKLGDRARGSVNKAYRAGVKIAFGTDSGVIPHGHNAEEFEQLAKAGVPPQAAIKMATKNAAELLGLDKEVGTLRSGMAADLIATDQSPLDDISQLKSVTFVMKGGVVFKD